LESKIYLGRQGRSPRFILDITIEEKIIYCQTKVWTPVWTTTKLKFGRVVAIEAINRLLQT